MWGRDLKRPHALCWLIFFFWARASSWPYSPRATRDESGKPLTARQKRPWECYRDALWICSRLVLETKSMIPNTAHNNPRILCICPLKPTSLQSCSVIPTHPHGEWVLQYQSQFKFLVSQIAHLEYSMCQWHCSIGLQKLILFTPKMSQVTFVK